MAEGNKENVIEWLTGQKVITLTLTQERMINRVRRLKKAHPDKVKIKTNKDGSVLAKLPLSALKLNIIVKEQKEYTDEEKAAIRKRLQAGKKAKAQDSDWD